MSLAITEAVPKNAVCTAAVSVEPAGSARLRCATRAKGAPAEFRFSCTRRSMRSSGCPASRHHAAQTRPATTGQNSGTFRRSLISYERSRSMRRPVQVHAQPAPRECPAAAAMLMADHEKGDQPFSRSRRPFSRSHSRFFTVSRLSAAFLPRPRASSTLARPFSLK